jgi:hypothetical protein
MFLSITGVTADNRLAKYQPFEKEADADAHAAAYSGFVVSDPGGNQALWTVDASAKTVTRDADAEAAAEAARAAEEVQSNRRQAYQAESDVLFFEEQAGEAAAGTWAAKRAEIKMRFPK